MEYLLWENSKDGSLRPPQESIIKPLQHQGCESVDTSEKLLEEFPGEPPVRGYLIQD